MLMVLLKIMSFTTSVNLLPCIRSDLERSLTVYSANIAKKGAFLPNLVPKVTLRVSDECFAVISIGTENFISTT